MIGFHYQGNSDGWPLAVAKLPPGAPVKFVDGIQRATEAKSVNPNVHVNIRHHVMEQNPTGDMHAQARRFFASFVDDSFRRGAWAINSVSEYNEYFADSQSKEEQAHWVRWIQACVDVWRDEYRTQRDYAHIDLVLGETAVGNNLPLAVAKIAHENPFCILGYHPYIPVFNKRISPEHWRWYSGRWDSMDQVFRYNGYRVRWFFGEFGAVGINGEPDADNVWPNSLAPNDGWRHPRVYNGDINAYLEMMTEWVRLSKNTLAWREGRVIGAVLFTSGGGSDWKYFEVRQPEMSMIANHVNNLMPDDPPVPVEPPPPPAEIPNGLPRVQYARTVHVLKQTASIEEAKLVLQEAYRNRQTVGFSHDDAGIGALGSKAAVLWNITTAEQPAYRKWYADHYPGTRVEFRTIPPPNGYKPIIIPNKVVDVSQWQGEIDWGKMAQHGVSHVYIRSTIGDTRLDNEYVINAYGAATHNIEYGAYHYFVHGRDGASQADNFLRRAENPGTMPPALDIEGVEGSAPPEPEQWLIWLEIVEDQLGIKPVIYTAAWYWNRQNLGGPIDWAKRYNLWVANYTSRATPIIPDDWDTWWLWQYGQDDGSPYGVQSSKIDVNRFNAL